MDREMSANMVYFRLALWMMDDVVILIDSRYLQRYQKHRFWTSNANALLALRPAANCSIIKRPMLML